MNPNLSFAYIQHTQIPGPSAHAAYVVQTVQAASRLGLPALLITPKSPLNRSVYAYYGITQKSSIHHLTLGRFQNITTASQKIANYVSSISAIIFSIRSWFKAKKLNLALIQTATPELIIVFTVLSRFYHPILIYDAHLPLPNWMIRSFVLRPDLYITTSLSLNHHLVNKGAPSSRIKNLPMGYDPKDFTPSFQIQKLRRRYFKPGDFVIGYIGRFLSLDIEKGIFLLLDCLAQIQDNSTKAFIIGGPPSQLQIYRQYARKLKLTDRVVFHHSVPLKKVASYIQTFDVAWMVYPRHPHFQHHMSPMKMIEYAAASTPTIASDFPSITQHAFSKNFYLVNPDKPQTISQTILAIKNHYYKAQAKAKRAQAQVQKYTWINRQRLIFQKLPTITL